MTQESQITRLLKIMAQLRNPNGGCPWDLEQNFATIAPYTIEEAYEVADAISRGNIDDLREELGDLLLQVVFHAQMADEEKLFNFEDVAKAISDKLVHRHPHVFGENTDADTADKVLKQWDEIKAAEKAGKEHESILDDVPVALPSLMRAQKISKKAAKAGFEWDKTLDVLDKLEEEIQELRAAITNDDIRNIEEELGDMLFVMVNIGRRLDVDCEEALRKANNKFYNRFSGMERFAKAKNKNFKTLTLAQMEELWQEQKLIEKQNLKDVS